MLMALEGIPRILPHVVNYMVSDNLTVSVMVLKLVYCIQPGILNFCLLLLKMADIKITKKKRSLKRVSKLKSVECHQALLARCSAQMYFRLLVRCYPSFYSIRDWDESVLNQSLSNCLIRA